MCVHLDGPHNFKGLLEGSNLDLRIVLELVSVKVRLGFRWLGSGVSWKG